MVFIFIAFVAVDELRNGCLALFVEPILSGLYRWNDASKTTDMYTKGFSKTVQEDQQGKTGKLLKGSIPADIEGYFMAIGPNEDMRGVKHIFDGQGMIYSAKIKNGNVTTTANIVKGLN